MVVTVEVLSIFIKSIFCVFLPVSFCMGFIDCTSSCNPRNGGAFSLNLQIGSSEDVAASRGGGSAWCAICCIMDTEQWFRVTLIIMWFQATLYKYFSE